MSSVLPVYPFDPERCIGTVSEVSASIAKANLPSAATPEGQWHHGVRLGAGQVGEFVLVECEALAIFGRILNVKLPEKERLSVQPELGRSVEAHPLGTIQLLATIALHGGEVTTGIVSYPRLGSRVYAAHPRLVQWIALRSSRENPPPTKTLHLANLPFADATAVHVSPERLFGRHCAILGATGGGKSYTVARLIEECCRYNTKIVLLDATGEFHTLGMKARHRHIGDPSGAAIDGSTEVVLPYRMLTEQDLLAIFSPSAQTQAPKLRAAMKSLKLAALDSTLADDGVIIKATRSRVKFDQAARKYAADLDRPDASFDITRLARQVDEECVYNTGFQDPSVWGKKVDTEVGYCTTLVTRIEGVIKAPELACIFQPGQKASLQDEMNAFLASPADKVLRLSLRDVPFSFGARDVVANAIGRHLLGLARARMFKSRPLLVFLDEAHQFLNKSIGEEAFRYQLDAFDLIAKEGRKFSLTMCIATQRPRDIPQGVLSQMGTLLVHRLANHEDREVVERASGDIDRSASSFLPTLAPGQAILIGVDFPIPLTINVVSPQALPDSKGPNYQGTW